MAKLKPVNVQLIASDSELYDLMQTIIEKYHPHLLEAKIALAWNDSWKADRDGRLKLGNCKKGSDLDRELSKYDFVISLNRESWSELSSAQRAALIDHELCHAQVTPDTDNPVLNEEKEPIPDANGHLQFHPKRDEKGRICYRIRKHDLEEFREIVARHGIWKEDVAEFAATCAEAKKNPTPLFDNKSKDKTA